MVTAAILVHRSLLEQQTRRSVSRTDRSKATGYAEAGMAAMMEKLRIPSPTTAFTAGTLTPLGVDMPGGRYAVSATREKSDPSLVRLFSTGYYYLQAGNEIEPTSAEAKGKFAKKRTTIHVKVRKSQLPHTST